MCIPHVSSTRTPSTIACSSLLLSPPRLPCRPPHSRLAQTVLSVDTMEHASANSPTCKPHHSALEASLSLFLCFGLIVSYLPQIIRIIVKKSSLGFSPYFLFLGATISASSFLNVVSLQWAVITCCQWLVSTLAVRQALILA